MTPSSQDNSPPPGAVADRASGLKSFPLFAGLAPAQLDHVLALAEIRVFDAGDLVLKQGDRAQTVFLLMRGCVRVLISGADGSEVTVKLFVAPALFGEMETLLEGSFIESVEVIRRAEIALFRRPQFIEILDTYPVVCKRLLVDVCERWRTSAMNQGHIAFDKVEQRLAALLVSYVRALGVRVSDGVQIVCDTVSQNSLARGIAATRKSVQRTLAKWSDERLVVRRGRYYVVGDLDKLCAIAGEDAPRLDHSFKT